MCSKAEFDKWDTFIRNHPDHIQAQREEEARWADEQAGPNAAALVEMRSFVPPGIWSSDLEALRASGLPEVNHADVHGRMV